MSPNGKYASLVAAAGYLPLVLRGEDYLELLPVAWRAVDDYGTRIGHRTYDAPELGPWRRQHSGHAAKKGLWEVHYDPYDLTRVFVRTTGGWITAPWVHLPLVNTPLADFTWDHARRLDALLTRAEHGPDIRTARVIGRTRAAALPAPAAAPETENLPGPEPDSAPSAEVVPLGVFDAHAEAERWL
ncbi:MULTISPECIES: Mu transposase C-terminal domain-containing protein [unclassified Streptomyces]|uniref:Mu transposase C-terminal domain-containing protein n=1 Tax=unclassified Streptomyces TaxID=2593676 RepID=UPI0035DAE37B